MKSKYLFKKSQAFTLLEVVIVIVVMAILVSLTIPMLGRAIENHRVKQGIKILYDLYSSQKRFFIDNGAYTDDPTNLDIVVKTNPIPDYTVKITSDPNVLAAFYPDAGPYDLVINENGAITCNGDCTGINSLY